MTMEEGVLQNPTGKQSEKENKRASVIETVKNTSPEKRVAKLIELGVLSDLRGYTWGYFLGRFYVFANINGTPIPIYKSSYHTEGKREDLNFFPFFGIQNNTVAWFIKSKVDGDYFCGIRELKEAAIILTEVFDFDVDTYVPDGRKVETGRKLNELLSKNLESALLILIKNRLEPLQYLCLLLVKY